MKYILLVDDDLDDTDLFKEALQEVNPDLEVEILHSGNETLLFLNKADLIKPDIIFIDVNMPLMDGWECLHKIKSIPQISKKPVVMYSTSSYRGDAEKAILMGALCFFTKPSSYSFLKKILTFILSNTTGNIQSQLESI